MGYNVADPYTTLGVARTATEAEIKKAYRKLAKELHPDKNKDNPKASDRFSAVTNAYDLLNDKDKRARFDRGEIDGDGNPASPFGFGGGGGNPGGFRPGPGGGGFQADGPDLSDIFENMFSSGGRGGFAGGFGRAREKGGNILYKLDVPFVDAVTSKPQRITLGDGKTIDLKLPAGLESGAQMRLTGKGQPGPGGNGDGIVTLTVLPHRFFERAGDDVRLDLPISLSEAVLGASVRVPTPEGAVMLTVPKGSTSGKTLRLRGRGFHRKDGTRGDQLVTLMVDLPVDDDALIEFVTGWKDKDLRNPRGGLGV
ncbi:molecular chaperone DnaJ [Sphingomonas psychrolutea]|uniref:Molecular chaperone DnaJ n=1 Tax=Sphingomonas psychrolutea TaxID=1259676 RepID=A0ABQ1GZ78_9SPHN|nr:molecular chaperone DnaJ [Sphingomonas psychrolutea]